MWYNKGPQQINQRGLAYPKYDSLKQGRPKPWLNRNQSEDDK